MDTTATTKYAAATGVPILASLSIDPLWFILIPVALIAAWLAKAAKLLREDKSWKEIRKDFFISLLLGASIGMFAAMVIAVGELTYVEGMVATWLLAFGGIPALNLAYSRGMSLLSWTMGHLISDALEGRKRQEAHKMLIENTKRDRERLDNVD